MDKYSIDERLEHAAKKGKMEKNLRIWKSTMKRLRKNGLIVTEKNSTNRIGEFYCNVSWAHARKVEGEKPNQANYLYNIAKEAQK